MKMKQARPLLSILCVAVVAYLAYNYLSGAGGSTVSLPRARPFPAGNLRGAVPAEGLPANVVQPLNEGFHGVGANVPAAPADGDGSPRVFTVGSDPGADSLRASANFPNQGLNPADLLPQTEASRWSAMNPASGQLSGKNYLTAGSFVGIDTVGSSLRNANYQIRSEPPNPQVQVSPWQQTTIGPDVFRRPLEIGNCES